jgi:hypothetical protein
VKAILPTSQKQLSDITVFNDSMNETKRMHKIKINYIVWGSSHDIICFTCLKIRKCTILRINTIRKLICADLQVKQTR